MLLNNIVEHAELSLAFKTAIIYESVAILDGEMKWINVRNLSHASVI